MSLHPTFPLSLDQGSAQLILMPCPGTKESSLMSSLTQLKDSDVSAVITLMNSAELNALSLTDIGVMARSLGTQWFHLAIEDDCTPTNAFAESWIKIGAGIHALLNNGKHIAIHCKGGSGRTGLVSVQILVERSEDLSLATEKIQKLRPNTLKLERHTDYIRSVKPTFNVSTL